VADKYAVYSTEKDTTTLSQSLNFFASLAFIGNTGTIVLDPGDTYTIPSAGDASPEAADKCFIYEVYTTTPGATGRTLKLPDTPVDGQIIVIKRTDSEQSVITVEPYSGTETIDGKASIPLTFSSQTVILRGGLIGGGDYEWKVLAEYKPYSVPLSFTFSGTSMGTIGGGNKILSPLQVMAPSTSQPVYACVNVLVNAATTGTFTINLSTGAETLATFVYTAGETGVKELYLVTIPKTTNPIVGVGVVSSSGVDSTDLVVLLTYSCALDV